MKQRTHRFLIILLALCLLLAVPASAEGTPDIIPEEPVTLELQDGEDALLRFVPEFSGTYIFRALTQDVDTVGKLMDSGHNQIGYSDDYDGSAFRIEAELEAGKEYFLSAWIWGMRSGTFTVILEHEHRYEERIITAPTCGSEGIAESVCALCGDTRQTVLPPAHSWSDTGCTACGLRLVDWGQCGDAVFWYLTDEGMLILEGSGATWNFIGYDTDEVTITYFEPEYDPAPWQAYYKQITHISISPAITRLGECIFWSLTQVKELRLPEGLEELGSDSLDHCAGLKELHIPATLQNMGHFGPALRNLKVLRFAGTPPHSPQDYMLHSINPDVIVLYSGDQPGWPEAMERWDPDGERQWMDSASILAPEELTFEQTEYILRPGAWVQLSTNADPYVQYLLDQWSLQGNDSFLRQGNQITALRPGTTELTLSSSDGQYAARCTIIVEADPEQPALVDGGPCGEQVVWTLWDDGTLMLSGTGDTWDFIGYDTDEVTVTYFEPENDPAPWQAYYKQITRITVSPEITRLGDGIFWSLSQVKELNIPEGVVSLGWEALSYCKGLLHLYIPSTVTEIRYISSVDSLQTVTFAGDAPEYVNLDAQNVILLYHGSRTGWPEAMENWYVPTGTRWLDMDGAIDPAELTLRLEKDTIRPGESVRLFHNADPYVSWLLTEFRSSDPNVALASDGVVTGLQPGTTTITLSTPDGAYTASCTVTVTESAIPASGRFPLEGTVPHNAGEQTYYTWTSPSEALLIQTGDGTLERLQLDDSGKNILLSRHDPEGKLLSEQYIAFELPRFGGFYSGRDYNYLLFGQRNDEEDDSREILRIVRYSKDWQRMDHGSVFGCNTTIPFDAGNADFAEFDGTLYIHTCHEMYTSGDGLRHQSSMTFSVDLATMEVTQITSVYSSHSFAQRVRASEAGVYFLDHGDAYPRAVTLQKLSTGYFADEISLLDIQGEIGLNSTGVTVGGLELSAANVLAVGSSVDQSDPETYNTRGKQNIFLAVADQTLESSRLVWLTELTEEDEVWVSTPQLVKLAEDLFLVLWEELKDSYWSSEYVNTKVLLVDGSGNALSRVVTLDARLSDCQPIVTEDGSVVWFAAEEGWAWLNRLNWYQLRTDPDAVEQTLGHSYVPTVTEPTCTEGGYTTYTCAGCGISYVADETDPLDHVWGELDVYYEPTCYQEGYGRHKCTRCDVTEYLDVPSPGHQLQSGITEPTCTEGGFTVNRCVVCSWEETVEETEALGHAYGEWTVSEEPGCTAEGTQIRTCARCGSEESQSIPPAGHSHTPVITEPTCTSGGYTTYTCACGDTYTAEETEALGHDLRTSGPLPTCTEEGLMTTTCENCDFREEKIVPPTGHTYGLPEVTGPTCTEAGFTAVTCGNCGDVKLLEETEALGHAFGVWYTVTEATEEAEGLERRDCVRCDSCETRPLLVLDHEHRYECVVTPPTCTEGGFSTYTCRCGDQYISNEQEPTGHCLMTWLITREPTCTEPGEQVSICDWCGQRIVRERPARGHFFEDGRCVYCGEKQAVDPFHDVPAGAWYEPPVLWAVEKGITSGTGNGNFSPDKTCTRAQVVTFLWRAMGQPEPELHENPFEDVRYGDYFYEAALWAYHSGITSGTSKTTFAPNNPCTRGQVVTFLWRAMGLPAPTTHDNPFTDVVSGTYYYAPVFWAVENGITSGTSATTFAPNNPCTRAQVVTFLYRALKEQ